MACMEEIRTKILKCMYACADDMDAHRYHTLDLHFNQLIKCQHVLEGMEMNGDMITSVNECIEFVQQIMEWTKHRHDCPTETPFKQTYHSDSDEIIDLTKFVRKIRTKGRPRLDIDIDALRGVCGKGATFNVLSEKYFEVSESTLKRRASEKGISNRIHPVISDEELLKCVGYVNEEFPNLGSTMCKGALKTMYGHNASRKRIQQCLKIVDKQGVAIRTSQLIVRRTYDAKFPNYIWHQDANMKLIHWGIVAHAVIDGFSKKIMNITVANNNQADTVYANFRMAIQQYGNPMVVRGDRGSENVMICKHQYLFRSKQVTKPYIFGKSTANVPIERWWREWNRGILQYKQLFMYLDNLDVDLDNDLIRYIFHSVFIRRIQMSANWFMDIWNNHRMRLKQNRTPNEVWNNNTMRLQRPHHPAKVNWASIIPKHMTKNIVWSKYEIDDELKIFVEKQVNKRENMLRLSKEMWGLDVFNEVMTVVYQNINND
eukprot:128836_1